MADDLKQFNIPALILAGGEADPEMQLRYGIKYKAELPVSGVPMVECVYNSLRSSKRIGKIRVVGDLKNFADAEIITPGESLIENLITGMKSFAADAVDGKVLVSTSDIPFVTTESIDDFISQCDDVSADLYYPYILKEACSKKYPGVKRTCVKLAEGSVTGGNVFIVSISFVEKNANGLREIMAARKNISKLAGIIGISTLIRMIIAQIICPRALSLQYLENRVGSIVNAKVKAIKSEYPEIGTDIDNIDQLDAIMKLQD